MNFPTFLDSLIVAETERLIGQGYGIEAVHACVDLAFNRFRLNRLHTTIRPENAASVRLVEKLGMKK
ncbi:hypothetical protein AGMMS49975_00750 [Clostridia bacterium]|nr:hypothetical protein AGMMS49975_00750 [Clostridia bacterium]